MITSGLETAQHFPSHVSFPLSHLPQADVEMDGASNAGSDGERRMTEGHASQHVVEEGSRERLFTAREVEQIVQEAVGRREEELTQLFQKTLQEQLTGESVERKADRMRGVTTFGVYLRAFSFSSPQPPLSLTQNNSTSFPSSTRTFCTSGWRSLRLATCRKKKTNHNAEGTILIFFRCFFLVN